MKFYSRLIPTSHFESFYFPFSKVIHFSGNAITYLQRTQHSTSMCRNCKSTERSIVFDRGDNTERERERARESNSEWDGAIEADWFY